MTLTLQQWRKRFMYKHAEITGVNLNIYQFFWEKTYDHYRLGVDPETAARKYARP